MTKKCFTSANLVIFIFFSVSAASASAGWYPTQTGEVIQVEFCIPKAAKSPVYLQLNTGNKRQNQNVHKIALKNLQESSFCQDSNKNSGNLRQVNLLDLKFNWKVTAKGEYGLQLYIPNLHQTISGWPDGISSGK